MIDRSSLESFFLKAARQGAIWSAHWTRAGLLFHQRFGSSATRSLPLLPSLSYQADAAAFKENGRSMSAVNASSEYNGWNWYLVQPSSTLYYSTGNYQKLSVALIVLTILLEGGFIILLTAYNSRPVAHLSSELESQTHLTSALTSMVEQAKPLVSESPISAGLWKAVSRLMSRWIGSPRSLD